ncbi:MAG: hypothetical protein DWQ09_16315 [Proteobacteria bacterium]|nr:MAG: hypothetical protein DWQ09_16315 [Pseudomonadota bacterium]
MALSISMAGALAAEEGKGLRGSYESADQCFRIVAYEHRGAVALVFYGCVAVDTTVYHYVAQARKIDDEGGVLHFELPPRQLSRIREPQAGIAGHQSELPPLRAKEASSVWRLEITPTSLVLDCAMDDRSRCGITGSVALLPSR